MPSNPSSNLKIPPKWLELLDNGNSAFGAGENLGDATNRIIEANKEIIANPIDTVRYEIHFYDFRTKKSYGPVTSPIGKDSSNKKAIEIKKLHELDSVFLVKTN